MAKELSRSKRLASKIILEAFKILKEAGGAMKGYEVIEKIWQRLSFDDWEKERYETTGYIRWESILHFVTVDCTKAGYLQKDKGTWILTPEGEAAIKLGGEGILDTATKAYRNWKNNQKPDEEHKEAQEIAADVVEAFDQSQKALLAQYEEKAEQGIRNFILKKNPYEFQKMVAALLMSMGYHISFIAGKGKDGGIDIVAYQDALGIKTPRIKVQVKHIPNSPVGPEPIRSLKGLIHSEHEIGLFVTSGSYTSESRRFARETNIHIKLIDGDEFIELWLLHYEKLSDEGKNMLPLHSIYFLGSNE
jgi:restriction system protein